MRLCFVSLCNNQFRPLYHCLVHHPFCSPIISLYHETKDNLIRLHLVSLGHHHFGPLLIVSLSHGTKENVMRYFCIPKSATLGTPFSLPHCLTFSRDKNDLMRFCSVSISCHQFGPPPHCLIFSLYHETMDNIMRFCYATLGKNYF